MTTATKAPKRATGIACWWCNKETEGKRLPTGWHDHAGYVWCDGCWKKSFVLRAITIPVGGPIDATWEELGAKLRDCWTLATVASNWASTELRKLDVTRMPEMEKLPPLPTIDGVHALTYLYRAARMALPELAPRSLTSLLQRVTRSYKADRWDVIWMGRKSLRSYRYPQPYPAHNQAWNAEYGPEQEPIVSVELGAGERWRIRLQRGKHLGRQLGAFRQLVEGEALRGELALIRRSRDGAVLAKLVMWLPRKPPRKREKKGTLYVETATDTFLSYHASTSDRIQYLHADHVRHWINGHRHRLERLADNTKAERRRPKKNARGIAARRKIWIQKHHARLNTWTHEVSSIIAGYADRQGVETVEWDDHNRAYLPDLPYAEIRTKVAYKLEEVGVKFEVARAAENGDV